MYTGHGSYTAVLASSFLFQIWLISMPQNPPKKMHRSRGEKKKKLFKEVVSMNS